MSPLALPLVLKCRGVCSELVSTGTTARGELPHSQLLKSFEVRIVACDTFFFKPTQPWKEQLLRIQISTSCIVTPPATGALTS